MPSRTSTAVAATQREQKTHEVQSMERHCLLLSLEFNCEAQIIEVDILKVTRAIWPNVIVQLRAALCDGARRFAKRVTAEISALLLVAYR